MTFLILSIFQITIIAFDFFEEKADIKYSTVRILNGMQNQAALSLFNIDKNLAETVIIGLDQYNYFQRISIVDDLGNDFSNISHKLDRSILYFFSDILFNTDKPIFIPLKYPDYNGEIGHIEVYLNSEVIGERFLQRSFRIIIQGILGFIILSACFFIFSYHTLKKPLRQLEHQIKAIDVNNPGSKFSTQYCHYNSEFGTITDLLNDLLKCLNHTQCEYNIIKEKLIVHNTDLEKIVDERTKELQKLNDKLQILATTDPLTGIYNRRYFLEESAKEIRNMELHERNVAVLMLDLDNFKHVNDGFGHQMGDEVLLGLSSCFSSMIFKPDIFCRYGGEEFIMLLCDVSLERAVEFGELLRSRLNSITFKSRGCKFNVSTSIGLSMAPIHSTYDIETLIYSADRALYHSKESGRNCLTVSSLPILK